MFLTKRTLDALDSVWKCFFMCLYFGKLFRCKSITFGVLSTFLAVMRCYVVAHDLSEDRRKDDVTRKLCSMVLSFEKVCAFIQLCTNEGYTKNLKKLFTVG